MRGISELLPPAPDANPPAALDAARGRRRGPLRARARALWTLGAFTLGLFACAAVVELAQTGVARPGADAGVPWRVLLATPTLWFGLAALCAGASLVLPRRWGTGTRAALLACVVLLGGGWYAQRVLHPARDALERRWTPGAPAVLRGTVLRAEAPPIDASAPATFGARRARLVLDVDALKVGEGFAPARGRVWVRVQQPLGPGDALPAQAGDRIEVTGRAVAVEPPLNPGQFDLRPWARDRGYAGALLVPRGAFVRPAPAAESALSRGVHDVRAWWLRGREALRERAVRTVSRALAGADAPSRALGLSLLLGAEPADAAVVDASGAHAARTDGDPDPLAPDAVSAAAGVRDAFTRLGLAHVLAISGFHIVVVAWVVLLLVRVTGDHGALEPALTALAVGVFLLVVPAGAPVARAGVIVLVLLLSEALGRRYDRLTVLAWTGLGLLIARPTDAWSLGLQLSWGLTALLLWLGGPLRDAMFPPRVVTGLEPPDPTFARRVRAWVRDLFSGSLLCWAVSAPLVAARTGLVSPLAVLSTLVVLPLIVVLMVAGYGVLLVGAFVPPAADAGATVLAPLASACIALVQWLDGLPGASLRVAPPPWWWALPATLALLAIFARRRLAWSRGGAWAWVMLLVLSVGWYATHRGADRLGPGVALRVDVLAVGDGGAVLVRAGGARRGVLIDCGSSRGAGAPSVGADEVPRALAALGVTWLDALVLTSPAPASLAGAADLAQRVPVARVLALPGVTQAARADDEPGLPARRALGGLAELGVPVEEMHADAPLLLPGVGLEASEDGGAGVVRVLVEGRAAVEVRSALTAAAAGAVAVTQPPGAGLRSEGPAEVLIVRDASPTALDALRRGQGGAGGPALVVRSERWSGGLLGGTPGGAPPGAIADHPGEFITGRDGMVTLEFPRRPGPARARTFRGG